MYKTITWNWESRDAIKTNPPRPYELIKLKTSEEERKRKRELWKKLGSVKIFISRK